MYAASLLWSVRAVGRRMDALLAADVVSEHPDAWSHVDAVQATVLDVSELLAAFSPLHIAGGDADGRFRTVLDGVLAADALDPGSVAAAAGVPRDELVAHEQVSVVGDRVVVRVGDDWVPVLAVLSEAFADLVGRADRIDGRFRADGVPADDPLAASWRATAAMVERTAATLDDLLAAGGFLERHDRERDGSLRFAEWTIDRIHAHDGD